MTVGELFAGIHGFGLGFERAGLKTLWAVEIDENCQKVSRRHFPDLLRVSDVRDAGGWLPPVDVIAFGSPCQDLSVAGQRKGLVGERSGLFFEAMRVIRECRPRFAVWENVPGAFSSNGGNDFRAVLREFLDSGARDVAWRVLDAQYFGVPQRRRRVFVVADFGGECAAEILFERERVRWNPPSRRQARESVAGTLKGGSGRRGWSDPSDGNGGGLAIHPDVASPLRSAGPGVSRVGDSRGQDTLVAAVTSKWAKGSCGPAGDEVQNLVAHTLSSNGADASEDGTGRGTPIVVAPPIGASGAAESRPGNERTETEALIVHENMSGSLTAADHVRAIRANASHSYQMVQSFGWNKSASQTMRVDDTTDALQASESFNPAVAFDQNQRNEVREMQTAGALEHQPGMKQQTYIRSCGVRRLTPTECERLQGFPDNFTAGLSDSARYLMLGNAVAVPVAEWIGRRLLMVHEH